MQTVEHASLGGVIDLVSELRF